MVEINRFQELIEKFQAIVPEDVLADKNQTYTTLPADKQRAVDPLLLSILDVLEAISTNIRAGVLDYGISYDYLVRYVRVYAWWSEPYIRKQRDRYGENKMFENLQIVACEWETKRTGEAK